MNKKTAINIIYTALYQILLVILPIITTPYVSRVLGVNNVGTNSYASNITSYFVLFGEMGMSLYGRREIAAGRDDINKRTLVFKQLCFVRILLNLILIAIYYIFIRFISNSNLTLLLIYSLNIWANLMDITWFFQGLGEFKLVTVRNFIIRILGVIAIFIFVKKPSDLYAYAAISGVSGVLTQLSLWPMVKKRICPIRFNTIGLKRHIYYSFMMFIPTIFSTLYGKVDILMLGIFNTHKEVGVYTQAENIISIVTNVINSVPLVFMPVLSNMISNGMKKDEIEKTLEENSRFTWLVSIPLMCGIIGIANVFTPVFFGAGYEKVEYLLYILSFEIVIIGLNNIYGGQYLIASLHQKEFNISVIIASCLNVVMNVFLIPNFASIGAAFASIVTEFIMMLIQRAYTLKDIHFSARPNVNYIIGGLLIILMTRLTGLIFGKTIISLIMEIAVGICVYMLVMILRKDIFYKKALYMVKQRLKIGFNK